jgi:hypothetical protein
MVGSIEVSITYIPAAKGKVFKVLLTFMLVGDPGRLREGGGVDRDVHLISLLSCPSSPLSVHPYPPHLSPWIPEHD